MNNEVEVEAETIGDWAGHTPKREAETEDVFSFTLEQRADNVISQQLFGLTPYIILKLQLDDDGQAIFNIEVGGGAELDGLGDVLEGIGKLLNQAEAVEKIDAAVAAAKEQAEQDYDDE